MLRLGTNRSSGRSKISSRTVLQILSDAMNHEVQKHINKKHTTYLRSRACGGRCFAPKIATGRLLKAIPLANCMTTCQELAPHLLGGEINEIFWVICRTSLALKIPHPSCTEVDGLHVCLSLSLYQQLISLCYGYLWVSFWHSGVSA
jgi:hypothetical protein